MEVANQTYMSSSKPPPLPDSDSSIYVCEKCSIWPSPAENTVPASERDQWCRKMVR